VGAANVLKVFHAWNHLGDRPARLLIYMALRARDHDATPWYGAGHDELAAIALGLPMTTPAERIQARRRVRRAMTVLHQQGAVTTHRNAIRGRQAVYLLWLDRAAPVDKRTNRRSNIDLRPSETVGHETAYGDPTVGHSVDDRRSPDGPLRSKEEEELQERSSSKSNLRNDDPWKADWITAVTDPWAEEARQTNGHRQASP